MEKTMKARVQHKHDIEANWLKATNFTPLASEIIVYDPDENYDYPRIKIGDGKTNINTLPFVTKDYAKISDIPTQPADIGAQPAGNYLTSIPSEYVTENELNSKGYLTSYTETDPTVPAWAKAETKPSYTKTEIGLGNVDNVKQYSINNPPIVAQSGAPVDTNVVWIDLDDNTLEEPTNEGNFVSYDKQSLTNAQKEQARANIGVDVYVAEELIKQGQIAPEYAEGEEWLNTNGDTAKIYVLPNGFIYAYQYVEATGPSYTNLSETVHENYRMGSSATLSALTGAVTTDFIPVKKGQTVRFKGFNPLVMPEDKFPYICFYTGASESNKLPSNVWERFDWLHEHGQCLEQDENGVWSYTAFLVSTFSGMVTSAPNGQHPSADTITHIRMCGTMLEGETVIVTVDEEITEGGSGGGYKWVNTGHAFVPADYEAEILALQKNKADKSAIPTKLVNPNALTIDGVKYDGSVAVNVETQSGGNILYGKKWVACGDSFTANGYNASDGFDESVYIYQDGKFAGRYKVYPNIIGLRNNMNIVNLATGGQTMANSSNSFMTRYTNIDADADYITIMLGINDKIQGISVGAIDSTDTVTFCGAFNVAMEHILENHPFAHVGIMVSHGTNEEIMEATRKIAERWGVPYLDYGSPQVPLMNRYTGRNVCAKAQQIREKNFCVISDGINVTNGHPNTAAHEYESTFIEAWLRTL